VRLRGNVLLALLLVGCGAHSEGDGDFDGDEASSPVGTAAITEVKLIIAEGDLARAHTVLALDPDHASERRDVWFYDTRALSLFDHGVVLRARKVSDGADDSTVKLRPYHASAVASSWFENDDFKCEIDRTGTRAVESCSLGSTPHKGEIDDVARGDRDVDKLFDDDQERFLGTYATGIAVPWTDLVPLGPIASTVWKRDAVTLEEWTLPSGARWLEASVKVPTPSAPSADARLHAWLTGYGLHESTAQDTKTRTALQSLVK
jgi:hypothetical protein